MAAPVYLTPQYITYPMIERLLKTTSVLVTDDPEGVGIYIEEVQDFMAKGEDYIIQTILSNYVQIPLTTELDTGFDELYNNSTLRQKYGGTYGAIRDMFISSAMWQIYSAYFSAGGNNNGNNLIERYSRKVSVYTNTYKRLDQAGNPHVKNAFAGLKRATNGSQLIGRIGGTACGIPSGRDQSFVALNSQPNLRWSPKR